MELKINLQKMQKIIMYNQKVLQHRRCDIMVKQKITHKTQAP